MRLPLLKNTPAFRSPEATRASVPRLLVSPPATGGLLFTCLLTAPLLLAQEKPDLVGTISFDVHSPSGRVETLAVTIGDGGTGPYKAILSGESSLPTHAIYRPRDLSPFGNGRLLPIVAFGNGGCRNGSGEFRNLLSDLASHGNLVVAIGPAGDALVAGSEGRTGQSSPQQLRDGIDWAVKQNEQAGGIYFHKIDVGKIAAMGQSCGTWQAMEVSADARVTTTVLMNGGGKMGAGRGGRGPDPSATVPAPKRYAPYAPAVPASTVAMQGPSAEPVTLHGPVAWINGGPADQAFRGAQAAFEDTGNVPAMFAYQEVGHYPATYRQPNGGAFAVLVNAWLDWTLRGDTSAAKAFSGPDCRLCGDPKWKIQTKNMPR